MKTPKPSAGKKPADNFVNLHKATVEVRALYNGVFANKGYIWFVWSFKYIKRTIIKDKKTGRPVAKVERHKRVGGHMVESEFVKEHGEANVKRMVIQNIVNKEKRD